MGASNSILPVPEDDSVMSPFSDCRVIVSDPSSKILIDSPLSVVILSSVPVVEITCCPLMYNDPEDRYRSLHCFEGDPKSIVSVSLGIIDTFVTNSVDDIDAVAVLLARLSKLKPVTAVAGISVSSEPSPLKEPVNEPVPTLAVNIS